MRACALPFGVSPSPRPPRSPLAAEDELLERVDAIVAERARVVGALAPRAGRPDTQGNFVWLPLARHGRVPAAAAAAGIMVRPFAGDGVRVTIGEPEANDVFLGVAEGFAPRLTLLTTRTRRTIEGRSHPGTIHAWCNATRRTWSRASPSTGT